MNPLRVGAHVLYRETAYSQPASAVITTVGPFDLFGPTVNLVATLDKEAARAEGCWSQEEIEGLRAWRKGVHEGTDLNTTYPNWTWPKL